MDVQKIPPIQQKRIVTFVNNFIIDTVSFLNKFINSSENLLWKLEKRMRKLEITLKLLEVKLDFVPNLEITNDNIQSPEVPVILLDENNSNNEIREKVVETSNAVTVPEEIQKYFKMVQVGVPLDAVKLKMKREGHDPNLLNQT